MGEYFLGLDLGQKQDFTALAVLRKRRAPGPSEYACRYLRRWPLGTSYLDIVRDLGDYVSRNDLAGAALVPDHTGVGVAVLDLLRRAELPVSLFPVTITSGQFAVVSADGWHVPKKDLVATLQVLFESRRIKVAESLPDAAVLVKELTTFKVRITQSANETFGAWREGQHDDLVLAVALAAWAGERVCTGAFEVREDAASRSLLAEAPRGVFACDDEVRDGYDDRGNPSW
jgi:hypothetical protein